MKSASVYFQHPEKPTTSLSKAISVAGTFDNPYKYTNRHEAKALTFGTFCKMKALAKPTYPNLHWKNFELKLFVTYLTPYLVKRLSKT